LGSRTTANAINTAGYVAGATHDFTSNNQQEVYLWGPGNACCVHLAFPHDRGDPWNLDYNDEFVAGLNNLNQIVGWWYDHSTPYSGFFYDGQSQKLNTAFNMPGAVYTYPTAINDNQEVVGNWVDSNRVQHGFYWNPTAGFSDISVAGDTEMFLVGINNQSVILGAWRDDNTPMLLHYVTIVNGQPTASVNVPKSQAGSTVATAINNVGQVVGEYETQEGVERGFIYTPSK
jgi:probable HAF family extracellular repeat protein